MKINRSIFACLLCLSIVLCGVSSSFAFSASGSNADYLMQNAQEFVPKYVPMNADPATKSNAVSSKLIKRSSVVLKSSLPTVANTIDRTLIRAVITFSDGSPSVNRYVGSDGRLKYTNPDGKKINSVHYDIPRSIFPTSGTYDMSLSVRGVSTGNILSAYYDCNLVNEKGVAQYWHRVLNNNVFQKSVADLYLPPTKFEFTNYGDTSLVVNYEAVSSTVDSYVSIRFTYSTTQTEPVTIGQSYDTGATSYETAQNTAQLVYSQNETNSKLDQIVQHISNQLAAMWDQLYNLMAVPWIQNDNLRTNNTINAIEDSSESTNTTIEQQSSWHANFIIDGLKSLFIPSETYFSTTITDLFDWFEDKFGFLGYTLTYFIRLLNGIVGASQNTVIRFPGITVPNRATNETYQILPAQNVDLAAQISLISEDDFNLLEFMRLAGDIVLVLGFIVMLQNKLHEVESK